MEVLTPIAEFVNQVGFPIAAFAAMYYMCSNTLSKIQDTVNGLSGAIAVLTNKLDNLGKTQD